MITDNSLDKKLQELENIAEWLINASIAFKNEIQAARGKLASPAKKGRSEKLQREINQVLAKQNAKIFGKK